MDPKEIRQKGDKFALLFIFVFLFIRLGIIGPSQSAPPEPSPAERAANRAQARIEKILYLSGDSPNSEAGEPGSAALVAVSKDSDSAGTAPAGDPEEPSLDVEAQARLLELDLKYLELEKEKVKKGKTYSLPLVDVEIDEETIFLLFPVFTFLGLLGVLKFRGDLLRSTDEVLSDVPLWALPIPFRRTDRKIGEWTFWNSVGLAFHLLILYTVYNFAFSLQNRESYSIETTAINVLFLVVTVAAYILALISAIRYDLQRQGGQVSIERP